MLRNKMIKSFLNPKNIKLLDGGTGEELFIKGVPDDRKIWSATAIVNKEYHPIVKDVHQSFIVHGMCTYITCNNYGITPGVGFNKNEIKLYTKEASKIARDVANNVNKDRESNSKVLVCGSLPPLVESYRPDKVMDHNRGVLFYEDMIESMYPDVDIYLAETISSSDEMCMAIDAYLNKNFITQNTYLFCSFTLNSNGNLRSNEMISDAIIKIVHFSKEKIKNKNIKFPIKSILFNCCEPEAISQGYDNLYKDNSDIINDLFIKYKIKLGAYPNRLTPISSNWSYGSEVGPQEMRNDLSIEKYIKFAMDWIEKYNVSIIGGCCGIGPEYLGALAEILRKKNYI